MSAALRLTASPDRSYAGFGRCVQLTSDVGRTVCIIGEHGKVFFPSPATIEEVIAVGDFLDKKKVRRALDHEDFDKAQHLADKRFHG